MNPEPTTRHKALPLSWVTTGKHLLLVGGGKMGLNRLGTARRFDWSRITVVDPDAGEALRAEAAADERIVLHDRPVRESDVEGVDMVIESTTDDTLGHKLAAWCRPRGIPLNSMDKLEYCDLYYPALILRGPLIVAISSSGDAPALSATLRKELERRLGPGWAHAARLLADVRNSLPRSQERMDLLKQLAEDPHLLDLIARNDIQGMREWIDDEVKRFSTECGSA